MKRAIMLAVFALPLGFQSSKPAQLARGSPPTVTVETPRSDRLEMRVTDGRPKKERRSNHDTITVLALERVDPPPLLLLVNEIETSSKDWPIAVREAHPHLQSFQLVIKDPEALRWDLYKRHLTINSDSDDGGDLGSSLASSLFAGLCELTLKGIQELFASGNYPANPLKYGDGVTCELQERLTLFLADGQNIVVELKHRAHIKPAQRVATWDPFVLQAVRDCVGSCIRDVQGASGRMFQEKSNLK